MPDQPNPVPADDLSRRLTIARADEDQGLGPPTYGAAAIAGTLNEVSHHGSQICTLRDLYRITSGRVLSTER
jgi:hypothetical protein